MEMTVSNNQLTIMGNLNVESSWEDISTVINIGTDIQKQAFNFAVQKGAEEGLYGNELVDKLRDNGCMLSQQHINNTLSYFEFKFELSQTQRVVSNLTEPETEYQYRELGNETEITSAQEKIEEFTQVAEENNGVQPSNKTIVQRNKILDKVKEAVPKPPPIKPSKGVGGEKQIPQPKKSYLSTEELTAFRKWCVDTQNINPVDDKPQVNILQLGSERDEIINDLARRVPEWKAGRKLTMKLLHPDTGGNTLAYQFFEYFDQIMTNISKAYEYVEFNNKIDSLKKEWMQLQ